VLDRLKHDPATRHIPVHIISLLEEAQRGMRLGAMAHLAKPVDRESLEAAFSSLTGFIDRKVRNLLVIEDNDVERQSIVELIGNGDVRTTAVATGTEALAALANQDFDCLVLDLGLSDMTGFELLEKMKENPRLSQLPVIVYTGDGAPAACRNHHHQGREVAGSAARRDGAVPAPRREQPAGREAQDAGTAAPARSVAGGAQGADRGR
jgi:CheY-like chemotaxis protein